jgi:octaprenyl-diphosphate synthase
MPAEVLAARGYDRQMYRSTAVPDSDRSAPSQPDIRNLYDLVADDFAAVNTLIPQQLTSDVELVEKISHYIVESGGKRLRPLLVLLSARTLNFAPSEANPAHVKLAAIIEFLHTATLLHDDVVDRSDLRRGRSTANALWGNASSVLVGDFLYSRAFQLMVELGRLDIIAVLSDATNIIAEGEVQQLDNVGNANLSEADYMAVIRSKTAMLFQAAAHTGAHLASADHHQLAVLRDYGLHVGLAYQLVDDWLDYAGETATMGKNVGDDLAEGKATLPLIRTMTDGTRADAALVRNAIEQCSGERLADVIRAVERSGALDYTKAQAEHQAQAAIALLPDLPANRYRDALAQLAEFSVSRLA